MTAIYYTATTLDGFIATEDDSLEWLLRQPVEDPPRDNRFDYDPFIAEVGAMAMGATTYQWLLDHLASSGESWPYAIPCWVFSHRDLSPPEGADVRFVAGEVAGVYDDLASAAGERNVWVVGGGDLAGQFADAGHLDEVVVSIAPVTLGAGRPLLPRVLDLEVLETGQNGPFVCVRYAVRR